MDGRPDLTGGSTFPQETMMLPNSVFSATISLTSSIQLTSHSEVSPMMGLKAVEPKLYISFSLDSAVPSNHLVRQLDSAVDFGFIRSLVKGSYSHTGQPSVDPVVLFKLSLLGYLYGMRSERRVCEEAGLNLAWRWFLGYELDEPVPDHSVLSKARRRFGRAVYERFFTRIVQLCEARGLVEGDVVFLDSTLSKANASPKSLRSRALVEQRTLTRPKEFVAQLWEANPEADQDDAAPRPRQSPGRPRKEKPERRAVVNGLLVSSTDPDAEVATKLGQPRLLAHKTHMVVDGGKAHIITAVEVRPATEGDAQAVVDMLARHRLKLGRSPRELVADAGYASDATWKSVHLRPGARPLHLPRGQRAGSQDAGVREASCGVQTQARHLPELSAEGSMRPRPGRSFHHAALGDRAVRGDETASPQAPLATASSSP